MAGLIRELNARGHEARQRFQISEASYRAARSTPARLWLRARQYLIYPVQLIFALSKEDLLSFRFKRGESKAPPNQPSHLPTFIPSLSQNVCVVSTNTFFAPLIATYFHPRVVHLVYDLYPEAMIHAGKWKEDTWKVKLIRWLTAKTLRRAKLNIFLGERLKQYVESLYGDCGPSAIIAVGADQSLFGQSPKARLEYEGANLVTCEGKDLDQSDEIPPSHLHTSTPTILYCGNFGNMHDSETLFQYWKAQGRPPAARKADPEGVTEAAAPGQPKEQPGTKNQEPLVRRSSTSEGGGTAPQALNQEPQNKVAWHFHCSGPKRAALENTCAQLPPSVRETIFLGNGLIQSDWIATMQSAEIALVTMTPGSETVVMPSKTYSAMMAGQAILAIAPESSDLVDLIREADCGWWVRPGDLDGLAATLESISANPQAVLEKRERAYHFAHHSLGQDALAEAWIEALGR